MDLQGQRILISGASGGLGRALAVALGCRGARLALCARDRQGLAKTQALALHKGAKEIHAFKGDVTKASIRSLPSMAAKALGGLDGLINNAGVHAFAPVASLPEGLLSEALAVNLYGPLRLTQACLPYLRENRGWVANMGSNLGYRSIPHGAAYSASKAALARFSESLRDEEARHGLRVFHWSPGVVITGLRKNALSQGVDVPDQEGLPYPRQADETAEELCDALESERRELISAAWPVKLWAKLLVPFFGGMVDKKMRLKP